MSQAIVPALKPILFTGEDKVLKPVELVVGEGLYEFVPVLRAATRAPDV